MRLLLKTPLGPLGLGSDGVEMALAFRYAGVDVYLDPEAAQTPLPLDIAELLTKRIEAPFDLLIHHADPPQLGISEFARRASSVTLAHTMWPTGTLDNCPGRSNLRRRLKDFDLVVGQDTTVTAALNPYVCTNAATVQSGYWPRHWPARPRDWHAPTLKFCMVDPDESGQDLLLVVDAFRDLQQEHPELNITLNVKTESPGPARVAPDTVPGLRIYHGDWSQDLLRDFYYSQHVLIAPSSAAGRNLPALEMMSTGGTVMAVRSGGHTQWLSSQLGFPLDCSPEGTGLASKDHLKESMLAAWRNRSELAGRAEHAASLIPAMCAWPVVVDRLMQRVGEINERGERVLHKYRVAKARADESRQGLL